MSLNGKLSLGVVVLLLSGGQLLAQWGPNPFPGNQRGGCRTVAVEVTDNMGTAIMGAAVATENNFEMTTDSNGVVDLPCRLMKGMMELVEVRANGYQPTRVTLVPDANHHVTVRLDRKTDTVNPASGSANTVRVNELYVSVQEKSAQLQDQAGKALAAKDYEAARKLYVEALNLTPSSPMITNNLGVISLHLNDLESAGSWFQKAMEEAPYRPDVLGNLGLVRWMQRRNDESYDALKKAFAYGYESQLAHYVIGTLGLARGDYELSAEHLKKAPADRFRYRDLHLSIALRNSGKTKAADQSYRDFLRRNPAPLMVALPQSNDGRELIASKGK